MKSYKRRTCRFGYLNLRLDQKVIDFNFLRTKIKIQNFAGTSFQHFDIYRAKKHILAKILVLKNTT